MLNSYVIIDFETTGLSTYYGDRITEVAAIKIESGEIIGQYESLVKTGQYIPDIISRLNGITKSMLDSAPPAKSVMKDLVKFIGSKSTLVAHNASFDSNFFHNELELAGISKQRNFICTLLLSRRLYQFSTNHKLETLASYHDIPIVGSSHRAMPDAMVTAQLFNNILHDLAIHNMEKKIIDEISPIEIMLQQKIPAYQFLRTAEKIHDYKRNKRKHILIKKSRAERGLKKNKKVTYANGDKYEGDWVDGKMNGLGTYTFANGDKYEGDRVDGRMNGSGTYTYANGDKYEGDWVDGKLQ
ncbi:MAG: hypothetical protein HQ474_09960 [Flammeovirgaceae bacterium]|nr:hypothetical protein [Flammeovirgaceae bacterium]